MTIGISNLNRTLGLALLACTALVAGCGQPVPVTRTTTTTEQITTKPILAPVATTTTETQEIHRPY